MKKKMMLMVALVFVLALALTACGNAEPAAPPETAAPSETAAPPVKNMAVATMTEGSFPVEVRVDVSTGLSVEFYDDGFSLFDGEFDDSTYPLVTATILSEEVYEQYLANNQDKEDFREDDGFYKYTSSIGEPCCLYKIGDEIPFMLSFEKGVDGDKADAIIGCLEFDY